MAANREKHWLLCYDIADPPRLRRIHRYMTKAGIPLQYSVFRLVVTDPELEQVMDDLEQLIDSSQDDIRIYPLHRIPKSYTIGNAFFPEGIMLFDNEKNLLA